MKILPGNNAGPQWNSKLLEDLAFIKKHLRYPLGKKTLPSALVIFLFLGAIARILLPVMFVHGRSPAVEIILIGSIGLFVALAVYQYFRRLKFAVIPTPFPADENRKLVDKFLRSQQLATFTHPQAPEVLQIISTPIGNPKNEQREVMIFIADDNRILINSHFTNQRFTITQSSGNYKMMAARLNEWIRNQYLGKQNLITS